MGVREMKDLILSKESEHIKEKQEKRIKWERQSYKKIKFLSYVCLRMEFGFHKKN